MPKDPKPAEQTVQPPPDYTPTPVPYLRLARILALIASILVGVAAFWGLRHIVGENGGLSSWLVPAVVSAALVAMLAGAWHILFGHAVTSDQTDIGLPLVIAAGVGLTAIHIATSSWFLATEIGGRSALEHHRALALNALTAAASYLSGQSERDRAVLAAANQAHGSIDRLLGCEIRNGCISGLIGRGRVAQEVERALGALSDHRRDLEATLNRRPTLLEEVRAQIETARQALYAQDGNAFDRAVNAAIAGLGTAQAVDPSRVLADIGGVSRLSAVNGAISSLSSVLNNTQFGAPIDVPLYIPMDRATAVIDYAEEIAFAWAVAVAVDSLPLVLLFLLLLGRHLEGRSLAAR